MNLTGKVVLITGGAKRIGRTIALSFASKGAKLAIHYNTSFAQAKHLSQRLKANSQTHVELFQSDLNKPQAPMKLAQAVAKRFSGHIDILINSASIYHQTPFNQTTLEDWDKHLDINARAPFFLSQSCAQYLSRRGDGLIINIADWSAYRPYPDYGPYCVSKAALLCLNKILAKSLAPKIRVNAILPGPVLTPDAMSNIEKKKIAQATLLKRLGTPQAVADACLFLAESGNYSTGAELTIDGGRLIA